MLLRVVLFNIFHVHELLLCNFLRIVCFVVHMRGFIWHYTSSIIVRPLVEILVSIVVFWCSKVLTVIGWAFFNLGVVVILIWWTISFLIFQLVMLFLLYFGSGRVTSVLVSHLYFICIRTVYTASEGIVSLNTRIFNF